MLKFDPRWRFKPPSDGRYFNSAVPAEALWEFDRLIGQVATQGERWKILEHFKAAFARAAGSSTSWSSSESWAETDLDRMMRAAAENAALFLEAFFEACLELGRTGLVVPDTFMINAVCEKFSVGCFLDPPNLLLRENIQAISVTVNEKPPTVAEHALELLHGSLERADQLLSEGRYREAVQETLWVLESLTTAFRGVESEGSTVEGKYFNDIVRDLQRLAKGKTLEQALKWIVNLHGYLSSPTGGGVRHGLDLSSGVEIEANEAKLFCNLVKSYVSYLLAEHERIAT